MTTPHDPTPACQNAHCYGCHGDHDPLMPAWLWCWECGHAWTPRALRRAYRRNLLSDDRWSDRPWWRGNEWHSSIARVLWRVLTVRASNVHFCPLCAHDF